VPVRIVVKDQANECELFKPRVTVARDGAAHPASSIGAGPATSHIPEPRNASDARAAFDSLFKKPD
jgi:hypothetical protein